MNKTKLLRTDIKSRISSALTAGGFAGVEIYYQKAMVPGKTYIVYNLDEVMREDERIHFELELNVIDYGTATDNADNIADTLQAALDHGFFTTDELAYYAYAETRKTVASEDEKIVRRRCTFEIYLYERN